MLALSGCVGADDGDFRFGSDNRYRQGESVAYLYSFNGQEVELHIAVGEVNGTRLRLNVTLVNPADGATEPETAFVDLAAREVTQIGELRGTGVGRIQYAAPVPSWPGYPVTSGDAADGEFAFVEGYRPIYAGLLCIAPKLGSGEDEVECSGERFRRTRGTSTDTVDAGASTWVFEHSRSSAFPKLVRVSTGAAPYAELRLKSHDAGGPRVDWLNGPSSQNPVAYAAPRQVSWDRVDPLAEGVDADFEYDEALAAIKASLDGSAFMSDHPEARVSGAYHKREPVKEIATGRPVGTTMIRWWITLTDPSSGASLEMLAKREIADETRLTVFESTQVWSNDIRHVPKEDQLPQTSVLLTHLRTAAARLLERPIGELGVRWTLSNHPAQDGTPEACTVSVQHEGSLATVARFSCTGLLLDWGRL